jgi:hypothetical protein
MAEIKAFFRKLTAWPLAHPIRFGLLAPAVGILLGAIIGLAWPTHTKVALKVHAPLVMRR